MNFSLSAPSSFLHLGSFSGIEEKTNSQEPSKLIFSQVKCHFLCFVLIPREKIPGHEAILFELEELIVPHVCSLCVAFVLGDLVLAPGKNLFGSGDLTYNLGENCPPGLFLAFDVESPLLVQNFDFPV